MPKDESTKRATVASKRDQEARERFRQLFDPAKFKKQVEEMADELTANLNRAMRKPEK